MIILLITTTWLLWNFAENALQELKYHKQVI